MLTRQTATTLSWFANCNRFNHCLLLLYGEYAIVKQLWRHHQSSRAEPPPREEQTAPIRILWSIGWLAILLLVAYPLALIFGVLYVLLEPFAICCSCTTNLINHLLLVVQLPIRCINRISRGANHQARTMAARDTLNYLDKLSSSNPWASSNLYQQQQQQQDQNKNNRKMNKFVCSWSHTEHMPRDVSLWVASIDNLIV